MAEQWGDAIYAARRKGDETTREAMFTYTNSNNTKGESFNYFHANICNLS